MECNSTQKTLSRSLWWKCPSVSTVVAPSVPLSEAFVLNAAKCCCTVIDVRFAEWMELLALELTYTFLILLSLPLLLPLFSFLGSYVSSTHALLYVTSRKK